MLTQMIFELFWMKYMVAMGIFLFWNVNTIVVLMMRLMVTSLKSVCMEMVVERLMTTGRCLTFLTTHLDRGFKDVFTLDD
jgi:hypothetical protein